jgi:GlpG protein
MRQITTLPEQTARTFADYLLTLKIQTQLMPEEGGTSVWVCDEDQVGRARQELAEFERNPADTRYHAAGAAADSLRRREAQLEQDYRRRQERFRKKMQDVAPVHWPVTMMLMGISIAVAVASHQGSPYSPVVQWLSISSYDIEGGMIYWPFLSDIGSGEVWRLVTPIFIHFGVMHLVMNMMALLYLGGALESRRGSLRFTLLVLVLAIGSNLIQYYFGHPSFMDGQLGFERSPTFGGMSGVLFGLSGYIWIKSRYEPDLGLFMSRENTMMTIGWLLLCLFGVLGPIANGAHLGGLALGLLIGYAPVLWRRLRGRE